MSARKETHTITLPGLLNMSAAQDFYKILKESAAEAKSLTVDASQVERLTTPCAQTLLACWQELKKAEKECVVVHPSAAFHAALQDLGLREHFDLPETCHG